MVWVNLLPWRQVQLQKRWRVWRLAAGVLVLVLSMLMLEGYWLRSLNHQQSSTQGLWNAALNEVKALIGRTQAAQQQLSTLQRQQDHLARRQQQMAQWRDFARALGPRFPPDTWLNVLHKTRKELVFRGVAASIQELHQLRDRLREITLFKQVNLGAVQRVRTGEMTFDMQALPDFSSGAGE
ncbi:PilN domain-containing protein [Erwinia sp. AnSW2-5]|uniref:PilN domain-containing protein n=1 Tax=Erwinia sp. AnSW2-5 TaxID=3367692 RepID=UPI0038589179